MASTSPSRGPRPAVVRRGPSGRLARLALTLRDGWERLLELHAVWMALFLLLGTWALTPAGTVLAPRIEVGEIAGRDYVAGRDLLIPDTGTTEAKRAAARREILPVYDLDDGLAGRRDEQLAALFAAGRRWLEEVESGDETEETGAGAAPPAGGAEAPGAGLLERLRAESGLRIEPAAAELLRRTGFGPALEERLRNLVEDILGRGVVADKTGLLENRVRGVTVRRLEAGGESRRLDLFDALAYPEEVREEVERELRLAPELDGREREVLGALVIDNLTPNLLPNRSETLARQDQAAAATPTVFTQVRKGQMIVRKGDEIGPAAAEAIAGLSGRRSLRRQLLPLLGRFLLLGLGALVLWLGLARETAAGKSRRRLFGEVLLLLLGGLLGTRLGFFLAGAISGAFDAAPIDSFQSYVYAVPFASLALVVELLYGRLTALLVALVFGALAGHLAGPDGLWAAVYSVAGSLAGMHALDRDQFKQRSVMTRAGLKIGLVNVVVILMLEAIEGGPMAGLGEIGFAMLCGAIGGILCAAVASFAIPVLESLLSVTTDIKLVELANTNLPLLRRLALEAPGTFQHSVMVANLAKEGCEAIGADPVLAYTGALYHDIGKIHRPAYFIENQRPGHNPHDKLSPSMSTLVLVNHIKDGLELARQHHLPRPLREAIEQHHGTRRITYFYNRAVEQCAERGEEVREEKYRYPGPRPRSKVMGVLMLADGVEAASRTLVDPTPNRIRSLVRKIVDACLSDGQLDETDLTLADIRRVSEAFLRLLSNLYHRRVDYPGFDFNSAAAGAGGGREAARRGADTGGLQVS